MSLWEDYDEYDREEETLITLTDCNLVRETDKGRLIHHRGREAWFPKSRTEWSPELLSSKGTLSYESWIDPDWMKPAAPKKDSLFAHQGIPF